MDMKNETNSKIKKIANIPFYTEGPAIDSLGNLFFTTLAGRNILKMDTSGKIFEWGASECPNGQIILPNDDHLICDVELSAIRRFDSNGRFVKNEIEGLCSEEAVYVPNDLIADASGNIYFTDSIRHTGKVFFLGTDGQQHVLLTDLDYPNGLVLSQDEQCLYVAESYKNRIILIELEKPGKIKGTFRVFATLPQNKSGEYNMPDGLAIDRQGNIWVAHYGMQAVQLLSPEGELLHSINTGVPFTSNLTFMNDEVLYITGGFGEPGPGILLKYMLKG